MPESIHLLVLAGANQTVASRVARVVNQRGSVKLVAPPPRAQKPIFTQRYVSQLISVTAQEARVAYESFSHVSISVWYYDLVSESENVRMLRDAYFPFAVQLSMPHAYLNHGTHSANFVDDRLDRVLRQIHFVGVQVYGNRNSSLYALPLRNFRSNTLKEMIAEVVNLDADLDADTLRVNQRRFRHQHVWKMPSSGGRKCYHDERQFAFKQNDPHAGHGQPHLGPSDNCYLAGMMRAGASLFPGFHYDVTPDHGRVRGLFYDCEGTTVDLTSGRLEYVNICPNDHLLY